MVVDSNVGYNKVNPNIHEELAYSIDLSDLHAPSAELTVRYANRARAGGECRQSEGDLTGPDWYEKRLVGCYWDYLRVLIPGDSQLIGSSNRPTPGEWLMTGMGDDGSVTFQKSESGAGVLGALLVVPASAARETVFRYRLPPAVVTRDGDGWTYRLRVQKQAGREAISCAVSVRFPPGATIVATDTAPADRANGTMRFALDLRQDASVEVRFRLP
jgi:hypothetical protein